MRLLVLDRSPHGNPADARSDALLADCARRRGLDAAVVAFDAPSDEVLATIGPADVVLVRADLRSEADLTLVADTVWALERRGVRCFPGAEGLVAAEDKFRTFVRLRNVGVPVVPTTAIVASEPAAGPWSALQGRLASYPLVVKRPVGWGGHGTVRCDDAAALRAALVREAAARPEGIVLVQPFVPHRRAVTALVVGDRVLSAWAARPAATEFRSNPGLGGTCESVALDATTREVAVAATNACALAFASVEFLDDGTGRIPVIEVNAMPGLWPDDADDREFAEAIVAAAAGSP